jgi:hypothetical protein
VRVFIALPPRGDPVRDQSEVEVLMSEVWKYVVFGCDANNNPMTLGKAQTYEEALKLQAGGTVIGWSRVRIFDTDLIEVTEVPTDS